ncbi:MAG TPA: 5'-methylthioadenosine/adenosylhomocysteine nucleosidase [Kofleriaceae bacterium]|jgi:adenosylhomocysteine nucleosidase
MLGIIAAMDDELAAIVADVSAHEVVEVGGRKFYRGTYAGEAVVCVVSRIGKVAAATTAAILVERFAPRALVMTGLAGALDPRLAVGDVVIADALVQHDLDARPLFPRYEVPGTGLARFATDAALSDRIARAALAGDARMFRGLVATGDQFFGDAERTAELRARLPDALCVEMEGAAIAQVAHDHGVPFALARTISDTASHTAHVDFAAFLATRCAPYARALLNAALRT